MARTIAVILSGDSNPLVSAYGKAEAAATQWATSSERAAKAAADSAVKAQTAVDSMARKNAQNATAAKAAADVQAKASAKTAAAQAEAAKVSTKTAAQIKADFNSQAATTERANARIVASLRAREDAMIKASAAATKYGKATAFLTSHTDQINKLSHGLTIFGAAAGAAFAGATVEAARFNQEMAQVGAFSEDARAHLSQLTKLSLAPQFAAIGYSGTQAAQAEEELVKAGVSAQNMINGGLAASLQLAAAGQMDVSQATEIASAAMTQFGLTGSDMGHVADLLAAGADKALGGVGDLGDALKYAGTTANQFGVSVDDTVGTLALFASNGQLGSIAGTDFKEMLMKLAAPSKKASDLMAQLGINVYDANGNFVGMTNLAGILADKLGKLPPAQRQAALATIFGARAMQGANILYKAGADGVQNWIDKVNDQGFAAQTAARKMNSLTGDLQKLRAAATNAFIGAGQSTQSPLRGMVQSITSAINAWNGLSDSAKSNVMKIVGSVAAISLGGAAVTKILLGAAAIKKAYTDLGLNKASAAMRGFITSASGISAIGLAAGPATVALGLGAAALYKWEQKQAAISQSAQSFNTVLDGMTQKINDNTAALNKNIQQQAIKQLNDAGAYRAAAQLGISYKDVTAAALGNEAAQKRVSDATANAIGKQHEGSLAAAGYASANKVSSAAVTGNADAARKLNDALGTTSTGLQKSIQSHNDFVKASKTASAAAATTARNVNDLSQKYSLNAITTAQGQRDVDAATRQLKGTLQAAGVATDSLTNSDDLLKVAGQKVGKEIQDLINKFTILKNGALDVEQGNEQWRQSLADLSQSSTAAASSSTKVASAQRAVTLAEQRLADVRKNGKATRTEILSAENQLKNARDRLNTATDAQSKATAANSKTLDINTQAGRDNRAKIVAAVEAMNDNISASFKSEQQNKKLGDAQERTTKATQDASKKLQQQKKDLINTAASAGYNRAEVKKMVDQMVLTPKELRTEVKAFGVADLEKQIKHLQAEIDKLKGVHKVGIDYSVLANGKPIKGLATVIGGGPKVAVARAGGGPVYGPGGPTDDQILTRLSNGEFVIKTASVQKLGLDRLQFMNATGQLPAFRDGGLVNDGPLNSGPNGARGPAITAPIDVTANIAANAGHVVAQMLNAVTNEVGQSAVTYLRTALSGGGIRLGSDSLTTWHGGRFTENFANHLKLVYAQQPFTIYQGGWRPSTSYSGSTHNKDAVDVGTAYDRLALLLREQGIAAWHRLPSQGPWIQHTHGVPGPNVGLASPSAAAQYQDYLHGGNGLGGKDDGPRVAIFSLTGLTGGTSGSVQAMGRAMMLAAGWPASQWPALKALGNRESGWNPYAVNSSSGAYGIGQALGHGHPYALDDARAQIAWMLDYIRTRYGSPSAAWAHEVAQGWYATGGKISGPGGPTSDRVPIMASNGEYMINAAAYSKFGPIVEWINAQGLATGGPVRPARPSTFGSSAVFSVAAIVALIRQLTNPIADLAAATRNFKKITSEKGSLTAATRAYNAAVTHRTNLRLTNAKQTEQARARVAHASDQVKADQLALQKLAPENSKIAKAQSALLSAENSLSSKRRSDAEAIAKLNDKINTAKKGSVAYENLIVERQLREKSNSRDIAAAEAKVHAARKAADKAGVNTDKITAAQKRLTAAENALTRARAHQSTVSRENALQTAQASAAVSKAKAKVDSLKAAADRLAQAQQALADSARQVSDTFSTEYLSKSSSIADWMQTMTLGNSDLTKLNNQIKRLRKMGLSETLIQQIIGLGQNGDTAAASAVAAQIISGGKKTITSLDKAAQGLQDAADRLGYTAATGVTRAATGGLILGPGTSTSDSINARLSNGEYVVNAAATARHRALLDHINYGAHGYVAHMAAGGLVGGDTISKRDLITAVAALIDSRPSISGNNIGYNPDDIVRSLNASRRSKLHQAGIGLWR